MTTSSGTCCFCCQQRRSKERRATECKTVTSDDTEGDDELECESKDRETGDERGRELESHSVETCLFSFSPSRHCASPNQRTTLPIPSLITLPPSRCPLIVVPLPHSPLAIENHRSSSSFCSDHRCELIIGKTLRSASSSLRSSSSRSGVLKNRAIIMACVCNSATLRICFSLRFAYSD
ncbi:uncharacterized protein [Arachis hypogaea]|uniref:uncharacterized protein n=1 Tax=Arachis hypogaea TaxID=3818 RepID=UPI003B221CBD